MMMIVVTYWNLFLISSVPVVVLNHEITGMDIFQDTDVSNTKSGSMARTAEDSLVELHPVSLAKSEKETEQNEVDLPGEHVQCPSESAGNKVTEDTAIIQVASVESADVEEKAGEPELFEKFNVEQTGLVDRCEQSCHSRGLFR